MPQISVGRTLATRLGGLLLSIDELVVPAVERFGPATVDNSIDSNEIRQRPQTTVHVRPTTRMAP